MNELLLLCQLKHMNHPSKATMSVGFLLRANVRRERQPTAAPHYAKRSNVPRPLAVRSTEELGRMLDIQPVFGGGREAHHELTRRSNGPIG